VIEENNNENVENSRDIELFKNAFRWKKPVMEKLVMQRLFQATTSHDPYIIIEHTANAASMVETQDQKVKGLDFDLMRKLSKLNFAFHHATKREVPESYGLFAYCVNFPFDSSQENYKEYIEEWKVLLNYYPSMIRQHRIESIKVIHKENTSSFDKCNQTIYVATAEDMKIIKNFESSSERKHFYRKKLPERCPSCNRPINIDWFRPDYEEIPTTIVYPFPEWSFFFEAASCLAEDAFNRLRNSFSCWAKDKCGHAIAVMSSLISPNVYDEVAELFKKPSQQGERNQ
jgi:hypothetical protein